MELDVELGALCMLCKYSATFFFLTFNAETGSQEVAQALREVVIPLVQLPEQLGLKDCNTILN